MIKRELCLEDKRMSKKEKHTLDSRKNKNKRSVQLCFLIGILSRFCSLTFQRPRKKSSQTQQIFRVKTLHFSQENFDVEPFLIERCQWYLSQTNIKKSTEKNIKHRLEEEKMVVLFELLVDIATDFGFMFITSKMKNKFNRNKIDFIEEVYYKTVLLFNKKNIATIGEQVSIFLSQLTSVKKKECILKQNNSVIRSILSKNSINFIDVP
ncbi:hypothetical protein EHI8A_237320 [Entamoeba histolytica HM-1:IMSS-B]|uniref:Uncharacterized protein n=6 Tax=Entamoeba histolytica TaxID=5759 RepID=C4MAM3_ENTH1|nr:hypothetical protein EHI_123700 [Entamoeba histolytica HM-1:IMSS]EMD44931.1 Hypothetical protein EHI5A_034780 [Entamoeba histolytica KU27]EMH73530.1 hypothetical protein EHI8A_237320 [Entamoeba histolytica HM-1:IMSS-B]EMS13575.1 hypothetical protein KM1_290600 [Entamoeba histolytica HM-3:IMSS]ENY64738.1 hypothetical protein EHI7A_190220 [Entamoeba histolytica HM-1:IMSS-A]GAT98868.1 hypothetical protein CL6EHI_123700 [Entamoeba histolytica]|eukprot:XP_653787.1 hypothetical protein EHI_123700 [Entamoeba histolytica HM-1:IMSS]